MSKEKTDSALSVVYREATSAELLAAFSNNEVQLKKEIAFATQVISQSSALQKCTPESVRIAVYNAARSGLTLNPLMNQSDLIPRWKDGKYQCSWEPRYNGLITKMVSIGVVSKVISCEPIYENDAFEADFVNMKIVKYVPYFMRADLPEVEGRIDHGREIGAFIKALLANGEEFLLIRGRDYINDICEKSESVKSYRRKSKDEKAKASLPLWLDPAWRPAMIRKTMVKLLWGQIPKPENINLDQMAAIVSIDNQADPVIQDVKVQGAEAIQATDPQREIKKAAADDLTLVAVEDKDWLAESLPQLGEVEDKRRRKPALVKGWIDLHWLPRISKTYNELNETWMALTGKAELIELPMMVLPLSRVGDLINHVNSHITYAKATVEEAENLPEE